MESYPESSVPVGGVLQPEHLPPIMLGDSSGSGLTEDLLDQYTEVDVSSEWLSNFVEECLSSAGSCLLPLKGNQTLTTTTTNPNCSKTLSIKPNKTNSPTTRNLAIPAKPRSQRKRRVTPSKTHQNPLTKWSDQLKQRSQTRQIAFSDPPLLEQTYWLADSELLTMPRKEEEERKVKEENVVVEIEKMEEVEKENSPDQDKQQQQQQQPRRCSHCQAQKTPQWRAGPMGPKTLCNACGMRYFKSGRLLPEYRPAKSPTFVSFKHSNSHKKVLQMRMSTLSPSSTSNQQ
ncbi:hypothetical protein V2J09_015889 [Rumex salicifolius]